MSEPLLIEKDGHWVKARIGRVVIHRDIIVSARQGEKHSQRLLQMIFNQLIIVRCEYLECGQIFEYQAYCEQFDWCDSPFDLPRYHALFTRLDDGTATFSGFSRLA